MKGVSEVIAIILILMITISIAGLAYTFMSSTMANTTSAASSAVDTTTSSMLASFTIENMDAAKIYIRNTGQSALTNVSTYVNDEPAIFSITPNVIDAGQVGTVTIYSFIPDGATIKIASSNGFSMSKVANPCSRTIGCWNFDEGSGTVAYDSSRAGNSLSSSGTVYVDSMYGKGLLFDSSGMDYLMLNPMNSFPTNQMSFEFVFNSSESTNAVLISYASTVSTNDLLLINLDSLETYYRGSLRTAGTNVSENEWCHLVVTFDGIAGNVSVYKNGALNYSGSSAIGSLGIRGSLVIGQDQDSMGGGFSASQSFKGIMDEVRVYDRLIY